MYSHVFWHARWVVGLTYRLLCFNFLFIFCNILFLYMHKSEFIYDILIHFYYTQDDKNPCKYLCGIWFFKIRLVFFITVQVYIVHLTNVFLTEIDIQRCVQDSIKIFCSTPKSATFRQHAREPNKPGTSSSRPNISYYSRDYNEQPKSELVKPHTHCNCTVTLGRNLGQGKEMD